MNLFKTLITCLLTMILTQLAFAAKTGSNLLAEQTFQKTSSVLPAGARLVAGNARKNEFYILGRMGTEQAPEKRKANAITHKKVAIK